MTGYFEETLAEDIKKIELCGYTITPWYGIAEKLKEMGYVVIEYADGRDRYYDIHKNPVSINGYHFSLNGKKIFIHTSKYKEEYKYRLVSKIIHKIGKSVYDYKLCEYLDKNIHWTECYCDTNGYKINGKLIKDLLIFRIY